MWDVHAGGGAGGRPRPVPPRDDLRRRRDALERSLSATTASSQRAVIYAQLASLEQRMRAGDVR